MNIRSALKAAWVACLLLVGAAVLAAADCNSAECTTQEDCGANQVCSETGTCTQISCTSSLDCPIESFCNGDNGQCTVGCLNNRDCLPTHVCDQEQQECIVPGCRNTQLDCNIGQFCNELSGQCVDAGGFYCHECESSADCGSPNNWCVRLGGSFQTYCGVDCSAGQECPRGYTCGRVRTVGDVTVAYQCIAPCWEL